jgi:Predicted AAA-ATPase/PD-(D/E)XK nuclease superfamily
MNTKRKKLPVGIETFSEIIEDGHYYVDKTGFALQLIEEGKYYFLSRPRRFGKSLFVDTLRSLFEGRKELFVGLYAENNWDWTRRFPVVSISFSGGVLHSEAALDEKIRELLIDNQTRLGVSCTHTSISGQFGQLLNLARQKYGERVVVLIDEYDKPILDNITDSPMALIMREGLKNLYSAIKQADADIRFVFMTGVSKFSKVSLFSGLNNLNDITLNPNYSALCGYTDADIDTVFAPALAGLDRDQIRHWYNGYNWLGDAVYNPYDLLLLLKNRRFRPWWYESGTPTFLIRLLAERQTWLPTLEQAESDAELLGSFDIGKIPTTTLMFQAGYLTIEREESIADSYYYYLRIPNHEVRQSLFGSLLREWTGDSGLEVTNKRHLYQHLAAAKIDLLSALFQSFFSAIPYQWFTKNDIAQYEGYYASVFYAYFVASGLDVRVEDATNHGRIDMAVLLPERIYLFEFKVVESAPKGRALQQLLDKGYADKYRVHGVPIHLIGVEFARETRNVVGFESTTT